MSLTLTKQAIAGKLFQSAARSFFRGEDKVGTYLLASASARIVADLSEKSGQDWMELAIKRGVYYWARDWPQGCGDYPAEIAELIERLARAIERGDIRTANDVELIGFDHIERRRLHAAINKQYNFIKHADVDALASIDESEIDDELAVARAGVMLSDLLPNVEYEEFNLFKYLSQRKLGRGYSLDVQPYAPTFDKIPESELMESILSYLDWSAAQ